MREAVTATERLRRVSGVVLTLYWVAMFVATHLPPSQVNIPGGSDKSIHAMAFFGLGFLLSLWSWLKRALTNAVLVRLWLIILGYACVDELLQGPVGRTPDVADAVADMIGATAGIAAAAFLGSRCEGFLNRKSANQIANSVDPADDRSFADCSE